MAVSSAWYDTQIAWWENYITQYQAAMLAFATNGLQQSYSFDSGQQVVRVERMEAAKLGDVLDGYYNTYTMMCVRAGKQPMGLQARPDW